MNIDIHIDSIKDEFSKLRDTKKKVFNYLLIVKLQPFYNRFVDLSNFGDKNIYQESLKVLKSYIWTNRETEVSELLKVLMENTPDSEDFQDVIASYALDGCLGLMRAMNFVKNQNEEEVLEIIKHIHSIIDTSVLEKGGINFPVDSDSVSQFVMESEIMKLEILNQNHLINFLKSNSFSIKDRNNINLIEKELFFPSKLIFAS